MEQESNDPEKDNMRKILRDAGEKVGETLSMLIGHPVEAEFVGLESKKTDIRPGRDRRSDVIVYTKLKTGEDNYAVFSLGEESAYNLANVMLMREDDHVNTGFGEDERDALREAGNIVIGKFLSIVADHFDMEILFEPPMIEMRKSIDELGNLYTALNSVDRCFVSDVYLTSTGMGIYGRYLIIPDDKMTKSFFDFF